MKSNCIFKKDPKKLKIGVVGATGMVGRTFVELLTERKTPLEELRLFASERSLGELLEVQGNKYPVGILEPGCFNDLDLVFFSSGDEISRKWAPEAVEAGAFAIDNSAEFRMRNEVILCVPEVNGDLLDSVRKTPRIIANPNCTTIQLVVALQPLKKTFGISEIRLASYQAVSGAGIEAYQELLNQTADSGVQPKVFPHPIAFNCIPQIGSFQENGFTGEEMKVRVESKKILRLPELRVSSFTVRVPVLNAHGAAVWVTLDHEISSKEIKATFLEAPGLALEDEPTNGVYPQQYRASGKDLVYVGRLHQDLDYPKTWLMWIVSDNLRKGAALNGLQIAERIFDIPS